MTASLLALRTFSVTLLSSDCKLLHRYADANNLTDLKKKPLTTSALSTHIIRDFIDDVVRPFFNKEEKENEHA